MTLNSQPTDEQQFNQAHIELTQLLAQHSDKRVVVVGTTCTGKSTLLSSERTVNSYRERARANVWMI